MRKFQFLALIIFVAGLVVAAITFYPTSGAARDVKVKYKVTETFGKESLVTAIKYRLQKADGSWRDTTTYLKADGTVLNVVDTFGINGKGVFRIDEKTKQLIYLGERPSILPEYKEEQAKLSANFGGEDLIVGVRVLKENSSYNDGRITSESYRAPDYNGLFLKMVSRDGEQSTVIEATELKAETITDEEFGKLPDYPVSYGSFQNKINALESNGQKEQADSLRRSLPEK